MITSVHIGEMPSTMASSSILTPRVLAAFALAKAVVVQLRAPSIVPRTVCVNGITSCHLPPFSASRALVCLFGNIFQKLDDKACPLMPIRMDYPIHQKNASPPLHECYKTFGAKDETVAVLTDDVNEEPGAAAAVAQDDQKEEKDDRRDKPLASHEDAEITTMAEDDQKRETVHDSDQPSTRHERAEAAIESSSLHTRETSPQSPSATDENEIGCGDSFNDADDNSQPFPGFIDCLCLLCQGHDVPEPAGDHHNTECDCHCCKPAMATITTHEDTDMDHNVESILHHPTRLTYTISCPSYSSETNSPYTQSTASDNLVEHSRSESREGSMADSGYDDSRRTMLKVQRTCEKLVILTRILDQQRAELRKPGVSLLIRNAPTNVSFHNIKASTAYKNLAKTEDRGAIQHMGEQSTTGGHRKRRKTGQWYYKTCNERLRRMAKSPMRDIAVPATITAQPQPVLSKTEPPITPEGQIRRCVVQSMEEYLEALKKAQDDLADEDVDEKADQWVPEGLFTVTLESTSYTVKMRARRAAYKGDMTQDLEDWIDNCLGKRADKPVSPTPVKRIRASTVWREAYRNRQAQLAPEDANTLRPTEVVAQGYFNTAEAAHNAMTCRPKTFLATPTVAAVPRKGWIKVDRPAQPQAQTSQHFFRRKKASRFTKIFEKLVKDVG